MSISVIIPAYNEETNVRDTILGIKNAIALADIKDYEIVVVDDHSEDKTFEAVKMLGEKNINCIRLSRRSGSHTALRAGLGMAWGNAVLCISADGQDDPSCFSEMIKKWRNGAHIVWALRKKRKSEPWHIRKPAQLFYKLLMWLGGTGRMDIDISRAAFFLMDEAVVKAINGCFERNTSIFGLIAWIGFNQDFVEYEQRSRKFGKSKWSFVKRLTLASDWIIGFSGLPLTLIFVGGLLVTIFGILYAVYVAISLATGNPPQNWSPVMAAVLLSSGVQMIMIGIIGEYLWRNLDEARKRPLFFIEKKSN